MRNHIYKLFLINFMPKQLLRMCRQVLNVIVFISLIYTNSIQAGVFWTDGSNWNNGTGYFNSLSEICESKANDWGIEYCEIVGMGDCPQYGGVCGTCSMGSDCNSTPLSYLFLGLEAFSLAIPTNPNVPNMCVGNPVDPVTGNKHQKEQLIEIDSPHPITFDLYYNSNRLEKWRHSFTRTLSFSSYPNGPRIDFNGAAFGTDPVVDPESPSFFGGEITSYGAIYAPTEPSVPITYSSVEQACVSGWANKKRYYHYSWIPTSVAELRQTPISSFGAISQCYILDEPDGQVKMILDIYDAIAGRPPAYGSAPVDSFLRFTRPNGRVIVFSNFFGIENRSKTGETLDISGTGTSAIYRLHTANDETEEYSNTGKLLSITSAQGHVQSLTYDAGTDLLVQVFNQTGESLTFGYENYGDTNQYKRIKTITDHDNRVWIFNYNAVENTLASINMPDGTQRQFHYEYASNVQLLTGITDETAQRYATWTYDAEGRVTLSAHGADQVKDRVELDYQDISNNGSRIITTKRTSGLAGGSGVDIVSTFKTHTGGEGHPIVAEITGHNAVKFEHNADTGYLEYVEDKGLRTDYSNYDNKGNPGIVIEATGTAEQRQLNYTYDPRYHSKIATITETSVYAGSNKVTTYLYDDFGNNTGISIDGFKPDGTAVSRTSTFQYTGPYNQLSQIDGPRTDANDVYIITYYPDNATEGNNRARMKNVFAALNITLYSNITYTATGKIKTYLDGNNVQVTLDYYYGNDRLKSQEQLDLNTGEKRFAEWTYLATGEVKTITTGFDISDKTILTLNYDDARRLTSITDGLGNYIEYILDSEGNVEQENIRDTGGFLKKQLTQTFDDYNRLQLRTQVNEQYTETWSPNGTLDKTLDGKGITTDYDYDTLKRLTTITQDESGSSPQTANALTVLNYDVQDNLNYVKNPVNGETIYSYDDLGNQLSRTSDDTGLTSYSHDNAGNLISMIDAKGEVIYYTYDALNRLISITTSNAEDDYQFEYDGCKNGVGRLCKVSGNNSTQYYQYDAFGNITRQQALQYAYDTANRLDTITYPSGGVVDYDYDLAGQVQQVSLARNGSTTPLAINITYEPFGDVNNMLYGNGLTLNQSKDAAYRPLTQNILSVFELSYVDYDENGNLKQRDDAVANASSLFTYDEHNRLNTATGGFGTRSYSYDTNANRISLTEESNTTKNAYEPQSNRLTMRGLEGVTLDNNGNTLSIGARNYSYTKHNRLFEVFDNGVLKATYQYNGLGQRISKTLADGSGKYFIYDTDGKLMAETDINGNILFEYTYLNGQLLAKYSPDTDIDGISNYEEGKQSTNPITPDQDGDGLSDLDEMFIHGTSVSNNDSDGDGISDSEELAFNSDPLDGNANYGDINLDGEFNLGDYVVLMQFVLGTRSPNPTEQEQADINQDDVLNVQDLLLMQRVLLGLQVSWFDISAEGLSEMFAQLYQSIIPIAHAANGDGDIYFIHNDHLGTPVKMTNELGFVVWSAVYDPFGKATVNEDVDGDSVSVGMNVRFPGQYYDQESGLHYNYFRTYDPNLGRYITSDPIGLLGGINTYTYVYNNPLYYIDPTGEIPFLPYLAYVTYAVTAYAIYDIASSVIDNMELRLSLNDDISKLENPHAEIGDLMGRQRQNITDISKISQKGSDLLTGIDRSQSMKNLTDLARQCR